MLLWRPSRCVCTCRAKNPGCVPPHLGAPLRVSGRVRVLFSLLCDFIARVINYLRGHFAGLRLSPFFWLWSCVVGCLPRVGCPCLVCAPTPPSPAPTAGLPPQRYRYRSSRWCVRASAVCGLPRNRCLFWLSARTAEANRSGGNFLTALVRARDLLMSDVLAVVLYAPARRRRPSPA